LIQTKPALRVLTALAMLVLAVPSKAHEGHDHGPEQASPAPGAQTDGSVLLPLAEQKGIQTRIHHGAGAERAVAARVIADPSLSAQLRAPRSGELIEPKGGFPAPGQRLNKGELIAWMKPAFDRAQMSDLKSELAKIETEMVLAQQKLSQYSLGMTAGSQLGLSPQFLQLKANVEAATLRRDEYKAGLTRRVPVRTAMAGVLSRSSLSVGRVVRAGDLLGELVEPDKLWLSALNADPAMSPPAHALGVTTDNKRVDLELIGVSRRLVGQSVPMQYRIVNPPRGLAVGQAMTLIMGRSDKTDIPDTAVFGSGEAARVWVQTGAERFEAKPRAALRDGDRVVVVPNARLRALQPR